jgi:hypothetical protein
VVCEFSIEHYVDTIEKYKKAGYEIRRFRDLPVMDDPTKSIVLHHDVDLSLDLALDFARAECENRIRSTYFILLYSPLYNTFSPEGIKAIRAIAELGHEIALQVDSRWTKYVKGDMRMLEDLSHSPVEWYSQHFVHYTPPITHDMLVRYFGEAITSKDARYYTHMYRKDVHYLSDSSRHWREGCFCQHIDHYPKLHLLVHPEWWTGHGNQFDTVDYVRELEISRLVNEASTWKAILHHDEEKFRIEDEKSRQEVASQL